MLYLVIILASIIVGMLLFAMSFRQTEINTSSTGGVMGTLIMIMLVLIGGFILVNEAEYFQALGTQNENPGEQASEPLPVLPEHSKDFGDTFQDQPEVENYHNVMHYEVDPSANLYERRMNHTSTVNHQQHQRIPKYQPTIHNTNDENTLRYYVQTVSLSTYNAAAQATSQMQAKYGHEVVVAARKQTDGYFRVMIGFKTKNAAEAFKSSHQLKVHVYKYHELDFLTS